MSSCFLGSRASLQKAWMIPPGLCWPLFLGLLSLDLPLLWFITLWMDGTLKPLCKQLLKKATAALTASAISFGLWCWCPQRSVFVEKKYTWDFTAAGVRQGKCRISCGLLICFLQNIFPHFDIMVGGPEKKKRRKKNPPHSYIFTLKPLNSGTKA